ncbi:MAG: alpha/beta fold hydrolase [Bacteroidota bacterium]
MPLVKSLYQAPLLLRNAHVSTIMPSLCRKVNGVKYHRERIDTPDGDFLDLDWCHSTSKNLVIITHGLEGSSKRPYVLGMAKYFHAHDWNVLAWNCRSCGGEINRKGRFYHHGETEDLHEVVRYAVNKKSFQNIALVGFSMGGSITIKFLSELTMELRQVVKCGVAASVPIDLADSVKEFSKRSMAFYRDKFLRRLEKKVKSKAQLYPEEIEYKDFSKIKYFSDFDNAYTAPLHGFEDANDFYEKASAKNFLSQVKAPLYLINALNDPFLTPTCYPYELAERSDLIYLETPRHGGHVGFLQRNSELTYIEEKALEFALNWS